MGFELVGVDLHVVESQTVCPGASGDEDRGLSRATLGLELATQGMDVVADAGADPVVGPRPDALADLIHRDRPMALGDEVLQELPGALVEPGPADRPLGGFNDGPPRGCVCAAWGRSSSGVGSPSAVLGDARSQLEHDARTVPAGRCGRHPHRGWAGSRGDVHAHLRQGALMADRELRQARGGEHRVGLTAPEQRTAREACLGQAHRLDQPCGLQVAAEDPSAAVEHEQAVGESLEGLEFQRRAGRRQCAAGQVGSGPAAVAIKPFLHRLRHAIAWRPVASVKNKPVTHELSNL